ncbi:hypothetical protein AK812_SmicGene31570 [Symbiodinium microadriaticum]|uniref:Integrase catalytic domain-containing protein n=1 Tax=Symbiodinium microadriaticum TaxID=2951 RepID=A0A1Q9CWC1_SYMMI|nr:hypothetical protein AK812_SmicGene31570 [Symbiodinium microadriaticum]
MDSDLDRREEEAAEIIQGVDGPQERQRTPEEEARDVLEQADGLEPEYEFESVEGVVSPEGGAPDGHDDSVADHQQERGADAGLGENVIAGDRTLMLEQLVYQLMDQNEVTGKPSAELMGDMFVRLEARGLLFITMKTYQPGGLVERGELLKGLTTLEVCNDASSAVATLQKWYRHVDRAKTMGSSVLCRVQKGERKGLIVTVKLAYGQCALLVNKGGARHKQHRKILAPQGWTLSVDTAGPFPKGLDENSSKAKYLIVGVLSVPILSAQGESVEAPADRDPRVTLQEFAASLDDREWLVERGMELEEALGEPTNKEIAETRESWDAWDAVVKKSRAEWLEEAKLHYLPKVEMVDFVYTEAVESKRQHVVVGAISRMYAKAISDGLDVRRVHTDRGKEFNNSALKALCAKFGLHQTFAVAEEHQTNGRAEGAILMIKNRTRAILQAAGVDDLSEWSLFARSIAGAKAVVVHPSGGGSDADLDANRGTDAGVKKAGEGRAVKQLVCAEVPLYLQFAGSATVASDACPVVYIKENLLSKGIEDLPPPRPKVTVSEELPEWCPSQVYLTCLIAELKVLWGKVQTSEASRMLGTWDGRDEGIEDLMRFQVPDCIKPLRLCRSSDTCDSSYTLEGVNWPMSVNVTDTLQGLAEQHRVRCSMLDVQSDEVECQTRDFEADWAAEVRKESAKWIPAMTEEYESLVSKDKVLSELRIPHETGMLVMTKLPEDTNLLHVLKIPSENSLQAGTEGALKGAQKVGVIALYVDDILIGAPKGIVEAVIAALQSQWELSSPEWVDKPGDNMKFAGFELERTAEGLRVHQESYVRDLLDQYHDEIPGEENAPAVKVYETSSLDLDTDVTSVVKRAQALIGQLLWLSNRTRPDLAYAVNLAAQKIVANPCEAVARAEHAIRYLRHAPGVSLHYKPATGNCGKWDQLRLRGAVIRQDLEVVVGGWLVGLEACLKDVSVGAFETGEHGSTSIHSLQNEATVRELEDAGHLAIRIL